MKKLVFRYGKYLSLSLITGCAASPSIPTVDELLQSGEAQPLGYAEYAEMVIGNSIIGANGSANYYRDDGVKLVKNDLGELVVRKWNRDDSGNLCQTLVKTNELDCLDGSTDMKIAIDGDIIYLYNKDNAWPFTVQEGNPANLSE